MAGLDSLDLGGIGKILEQRFEQRQASVTDRIKGSLYAGVEESSDRFESDLQRLSLNDPRRLALFEKYVQDSLILSAKVSNLISMATTADQFLSSHPTLMQDPRFAHVVDDFVLDLTSSDLEGLLASDSVQLFKDLGTRLNKDGIQEQYSEQRRIHLSDDGVIDEAEARAIHNDLGLAALIPHQLRIE